MTTLFVTGLCDSKAIGTALRNYFAKVVKIPEMKETFDGKLEENVMSMYDPALSFHDLMVMVADHRKHAFSIFVEVDKNAQIYKVQIMRRSLAYRTAEGIIKVRPGARRLYVNYHPDVEVRHSSEEIEEIHPPSLKRDGDDDAFEDIE